MAKKNVTELKNIFSTGKKPTGQDFGDLIESTINEDTPNDTTVLDSHKVEDAPHRYGGKFEWRYNPITNSLDLVVLD